MNIRSFAFPVFLLSLLACTKTSSVTTDFSLNLSSDDAFTKVVNTLVSQGFGTDQIDSSARSLQTNMKEIPTSMLHSYAKMAEADDRYEKGRYGYKVSIQDDSGKSKVHIEAVVEGYFRPQQASQNFGTDKIWQPGQSNGTAEQQLYSSLK